jgi:hypothetical protein
MEQLQALPSDKCHRSGSLHQLGSGKGALFASHSTGGSKGASVQRAGCPPALLRTAFSFLAACASILLAALSISPTAALLSSNAVGPPGNELMKSAARATPPRTSNAPRCLERLLSLIIPESLPMLLHKSFMLAWRARPGSVELGACGPWSLGRIEGRRAEAGLPPHILLGHASCQPPASLVLSPPR